MINPAFRFLSLGDSYTIGEGVAPSQRWPVQLVKKMRAEGNPVADATIIAQTGWTTGDLLSSIKANQPRGLFDLVTLLIGVNNQYQGKDIEVYRAEFGRLLAMSIGFSGGNPNRIVVLSIPDWSVTPFAAGRNRTDIARAVDQFNSVNRVESLAAGAHYLDITPRSRQAAYDSTLLAPDQLHPSGKMYAGWVRLLTPIVREILET